VTIPDAIVFFVDDDPSFRRSIERLLRLAGQGAIIRLGHGIPEQQPSRCDTACLGTDLRMPCLNGLDLQRKLASLNWQVPVIFITGHGDVATSARAMKAGTMDSASSLSERMDVLGGRCFRPKNFISSWPFTPN
jgi:FixJ family two-component response regulator